MTCRVCQHQAKKFGTYGKRRIQRYRCISCRRTALFTRVTPAMQAGIADHVWSLHELICQQH